MFKKPAAVTLPPSSDHVNYPYDSPWVIRDWDQCFLRVLLCWPLAETLLRHWWHHRQFISMIPQYSQKYKTRLLELPVRARVPYSRNLWSFQLTGQCICVYVPCPFPPSAHFPSHECNMRRSNGSLFCPSPIWSSISAFLLHWVPSWVKAF